MAPLQCGLYYWSRARIRLRNLQLLNITVSKLGNCTSSNIKVTLEYLRYPRKTSYICHNKTSSSIATTVTEVRLYTAICVQTITYLLTYLLPISSIWPLLTFLLKLDSRGQRPSDTPGRRMHWSSLNRNDCFEVISAVDVATAGVTKVISARLSHAYWSI